MQYMIVNEVIDWFSLVPSLNEVLRVQVLVKFGDYFCVWMCFHLSHLILNMYMVVYTTVQENC
jgi:hypothetical protein